MSENAWHRKVPCSWRVEPSPKFSREPASNWQNDSGEPWLEWLLANIWCKGEASICLRESWKSASKWSHGNLKFRFPLRLSQLQDLLRRTARLLARKTTLQCRRNWSLLHRNQSVVLSLSLAFHWYIVGATSLAWRNLSVNIKLATFANNLQRSSGWHYPFTVNTAVVENMRIFFPCTQVQHQQSFCFVLVEVTGL